MGGTMVNKKLFGEGKDIEYKREIPKNHEKFLKDVIAFTNSSGGTIYLGIEDETGIVYGIGDASPSKLSDAISTMIADACVPQINPDISYKTMRGIHKDETVLEIYVAPGKFRPYYLGSKGKEASTYIRINGTSRPADDKKIKELELEGQKVSYDSMQEIGNAYDEQKALALCDEMKRIALESSETDEQKAQIKDMTIEKLADFGVLYKEGRNFYPTHAFGLMTDNKNRFAKVQCALFKGVTRDIFIDQKVFDGPIQNQVENAYRFILRHINLGADINGIYREEKYELPTKALREMVANAIAHRSYLEDSCVQVSVFDDRVEVSSPGMLYGGIDIETAKNGKSSCRNAAIAEAFHYMRIIEGWGTGIPRIISKCEEYGLREPIFEEFGNGFKVTMFRTVSDSKDQSSAIDERTSAIQSESSAIKGQTSAIQARKLVREVFCSAIQKMNYKEPTPTNLMRVYDAIDTNQVFGSSEIVEILDCSSSTAREVIKKLKDMQTVVEVKGQGKGKIRFLNQNEL